MKSYYLAVWATLFVASVFLTGADGTVYTISTTQRPATRKHLGLKHGFESEFAKLHSKVNNKGTTKLTDTEVNDKNSGISRDRKFKDGSDYGGYEEQYGQINHGAPKQPTTTMVNDKGSEFFRDRRNEDGSDYGGYGAGNGQLNRDAPQKPTFVKINDKGSEFLRDRRYGDGSNYGGYGAGYSPLNYGKD